MPDGRKNNGGARPGAGRPSLKDETQLQDDLANACPGPDRQAIFKALVAKAKKGDTTAARLILSYSCGTPPSGDDLAVQDRVNAIVIEFFNRLAPIYGVEKAREILGHLASDGSKSGAKPLKRAP